MRGSRKIASVMLLLLFAMGTDAHADPSQWELNFTVLRDGVVVTAPSATVVEGQQADLTYHDEANSLNDLRMVISTKSTALSKSGKESVQIDITFYEGVDGEWILRSQPEVVAEAGKEVSLTIGAADIKRKAPTFDIRVVAAKVDRSKLSQQAAPSVSGDKSLSLLAPNKSMGCPSRVSAFLSGALGIASAHASDLEVDACCRVGNLTCCGAVSCCENYPRRVCCTTNP